MEADKDSLFVTTMTYDRVTSYSTGRVTFDNFRYMPLFESDMEVRRGGRGPARVA